MVASPGPVPGRPRRANLPFLDAASRPGPSFETIKSAAAQGSEIECPVARAGILGDIGIG